jgi:adenylosuccinate lyase
MLKDGLAALLPYQQELIDQLKTYASDWKAVPMLARTHGQTASPTTLGKELAVFIRRLERQNNRPKR